MYMPTGRTPVGIFTKMIENTRLMKGMGNDINMLQHAGSNFGAMETKHNRQGACWY